MVCLHKVSKLALLLLGLFYLGAEKYHAWFRLLTHLPTQTSAIYAASSHVKFRREVPFSQEVRFTMLLVPTQKINQSNLTAEGGC
jgi:hypothetical protein